MEQSTPPARIQFAQPFRQFVLMLVISIIVGIGGYFLFPAVSPIFLANLWLNGFILGVFVIGVLACFWQVIQIATSVGWIDGFVEQRVGHDLTKPPRLLASLAALLRSRGANMQINTSSSQSILDSVATRMDEARDITRYIVNLLIFLGLLGTFYGLATTIPAVVDTIKSLNLQEGDTGAEVLSRLMTGLESQLDGMGTAFGSSLLGLAGSLVVGLLELFSGHSQNQFYRELEEWLSTITRVGFSSSDFESAAGGGDGAAMAAVMSQSSQQMEVMRDMVTQTSGERDEAQAQMGRLSEAIELLASGKTESNGAADVTSRTAESNDRIVALLEAQMQDGGGNVDVESRMRLRSIDVQLLRILEEMSAGRQESMSDLRADINALTKAIRLASRDTSGQG